MKKINVLSLFDGISCARQAIKKNGIKVDNYFASEIDKYAIEVSKKNNPDIIHLGDVRNISFSSGILYEQTEGKKNIVGKGLSFDLMIGGSPCQDLSIAKQNRKGLDGERSGLFWEYVRLLNEIKPEYFVLENVASMSDKDKDIISNILGIKPIMINAALVSAQNRKRLFWVGKRNNGIYETISIELPKDKGISLSNIIQNAEEVDTKYYMKGYGNGDFLKDSSNLYIKGAGLRNRGEGKKPEFRKDDKSNCITTVQTDYVVRIGHFNKGSQADRIYDTNGKSTTLCANGGGGGAKTGLYLIDENNNEGQYLIRKLTPIECERLQGLDDNYTEGISMTQRYKCLGNAFNVDVIRHILNHIF